eukprot:scaffold7091_cov273-Chaetoceros_neogracile.AAC.15
MSRTKIPNMDLTINFTPSLRFVELSFKLCVIRWRAMLLSNDGLRSAIYCYNNFVIHQPILCYFYHFSFYYSNSHQPSALLICLAEASIRKPKAERHPISWVSYYFTTTNLVPTCSQSHGHSVSHSRTFIFPSCDYNSARVVGLQVYFRPVAAATDEQL